MAHLSLHTSFFKRGILFEKKTKSGKIESDGSMDRNMECMCAKVELQNLIGIGRNINLFKANMKADLTLLTLLLLHIPWTFVFVIIKINNAIHL